MLITILFFYSANSRMADPCAVQEMLARSSGVGVRHAFVVEQVLQDKTAPNH